MQSEVEHAFQPLIGLPVCLVGRITNLQYFHFGVRHSVVIQYPVKNRGKIRVVGEYALHIQCAWRITRSSKMIAGSNDLYDPADGSADDPDEFNWYVSGASRLDRIVDRLREEWQLEPPVVVHCSADELGGFRLTLSAGYVIEAFPDNSQSGEHSEHWRLFRPTINEDDDYPHTVVGNNGLEIVGPVDGE